MLDVDTHWPDLLLDYLEDVFINTLFHGCVIYSPVFLTPFNVSKVLGGIVRDENGLITGARAARMDYVLKFNRTVVNGTEVT